MSDEGEAINAKKEPDNDILVLVMIRMMRRMTTMMRVALVISGS